MDGANFAGKNQQEVTSITHKLTQGKEKIHRERSINKSEGGPNIRSIESVKN